MAGAQPTKRMMETGLPLGGPAARRIEAPVLEEELDLLQAGELRKEFLDPVRSIGRLSQYDDRSGFGKTFYELLKRAVDVILSLVVLLLALPLFAAIAVLVCASSPGPVMFKQRRLGKHGEQFWCLKFRTMYADAEERLARDERFRMDLEEAFKLENDVRITPVGRFLRKFSLDETPQLFNVLMGEMSLIGPRPIVPHEIEKYGRYGRKLLSVRPGLGGLWQASGRSDTTYPERVWLDMLYIDHRCPWLDLWLVWRTLVAVITARGAY